jgi:hypothetical protein
MNPMISFKRVYHLVELWQLGCQEVNIGGLLSLLVMLWLSYLALIDRGQRLHNDIQWCQQLLEAR